MWEIWNIDIGATLRSSIDVDIGSCIPSCTSDRETSIIVLCNGSQSRCSNCNGCRRRQNVLCCRHGYILCFCCYYNFHPFNHSSNQTCCIVYSKDHGVRCLCDYTGIDYKCTIAINTIGGTFCNGQLPQRHWDKFPIYIDFTVIPICFIVIRQYNVIDCRFPSCEIIRHGCNVIDLTGDLRPNSGQLLQLFHLALNYIHQVVF